MGSNFGKGTGGDLLSTLPLVLITATVFSGGCNSCKVSEESDIVLAVSEQSAVDELPDSALPVTEQPIYGIITDIGIIEFQAYDSTDSIVNLGMTLIVVTDSVGNETTVTFITGLYMPGDSLKGSFTPGTGATLSYFTDKYAPQFRPVVDELIPNVDGHLTSFALTEDLAEDISSRPAIQFGD